MVFPSHLSSSHWLKPSIMHSWFWLSTIHSQYITVIYNTVLHPVRQSWSYTVGQFLNAQKTHLFLPLQVSYGVFLLRVFWRNMRHWECTVPRTDQEYHRHLTAHWHIGVQTKWLPFLQYISIYYEGKSAHIFFPHSKMASAKWSKFSSGLHVLKHWGRENGRRFTNDIFIWIFFNENSWILIKISLKFVPRGPVNNIPASVQRMAWRRTGDK